MKRPSQWLFAAVGGVEAGPVELEPKETVPQITSEWHYRPSKAIRPYAAIDRAKAETSEVLSPELSP